MTGRLLRQSAALACALATFAATAASATEIASPLGGVLPVPRATIEKWGWTGAWRFPVGEADDFEAIGPSQSPYRILRNVGGPEDGGGGRHQGADLGCGHGGGPVVAAATGLVILASRSVGTSGYGRHVVLAHRLPGGEIVYTVYAHLTAGSIPVKAGQVVPAGKRIGRVGMSGRATTPHLHFEVRRASVTSARWENEKPIDPMTFVSERVIEPCSEELGEYLEWAQYTGLSNGAPKAEARLTAKDWWRMLAVSTRGRLAVMPAHPPDLADSLVAAGVLPDDTRRSGDARLEWSDVTRDLDRVKAVGARLPARPVLDRTHRETCLEWIGVADPAKGVAKSDRKQSEPTLGGAILALADLAPSLDPPKPAKKPKSKKGTASRSAVAAKSANAKPVAAKTRRSKFATAGAPTATAASAPDTGTRIR